MTHGRAAATTLTGRLDQRWSLFDANRDPFLTMEALWHEKRAISRTFLRADLGGNVPNLRAVGRGVFHRCSMASEVEEAQPFPSGRKRRSPPHRETRRHTEPRANRPPSG